MPITGVKHKFEASEQGWELHTVEMTVGSSGAVASLSGKRFASDGTAAGELGGIALSSTSVYTVTLPGYGGVQDILPLTPVILDGALGDAKVPLLSARTVGSRTFAWTFLDQLTAAEEELTDGTVVLFPVLVKQGSVS